MQSIVIDDKGTTFAYIDTGVPPSVTTGQDYVTIFGIHGMLWANRKSLSQLDAKLTAYCA